MRRWFIFSRIKRMHPTCKGMQCVLSRMHLISTYSPMNSPLAGRVRFLFHRYFSFPFNDILSEEIVALISCLVRCRSLSGCTNMAPLASLNKKWAAVMKQQNKKVNISLTDQKEWGCRITVVAIATTAATQQLAKTSFLNALFDILIVCWKDAVPLVSLMSFMVWRNQWFGRVTHFERTHLHVCLFHFYFHLFWFPLFFESIPFIWESDLVSIFRPLVNNR